MTTLPAERTASPVSISQYAPPSCTLLGIMRNPPLAFALLQKLRSPLGTGLTTSEMQQFPATPWGFERTLHMSPKAGIERVSDDRHVQRDSCHRRSWRNTACPR
jgi:hypothetical protein